MADPLLADLDDQQRAAVTSSAAPLAILAPAGSGKTRVLTRRIAYRAREGLLDARRVLAVTFTRKAAGELGERLGALGVDGPITAGTFHALALAQLRRRAIDAGRTPPTVLERRARLLVPLVRDAQRGRGGPGPMEVSAEIDWAKARMVAPHDYERAVAAAARRAPGRPAVVADLYARYEDEKRTRRVLDFDDLLWRCAEAIDADVDFAASQRFRFRHLFVDEFQDVSPLQLRLLRAWLGPRRDLTVVGDVAQAIYAFAGADPSALRDFAEHFPGASVTELTWNYRSTPQVVRVSAAALGVESGVTRAEPRAARADGPAPTVTAFDDADHEAAGVARAVVAARREGVPWTGIAVLFRTNAQSAAFESALGRLGVPCHVTAADRFTDRPEIRAWLAEMRALERDAPGRPFAELLAELATATVPDESPVGGTPAEVLRLGREYLAAEGGAGALSGFVAWLDVATRHDAPERRDAVELTTFHRAKGLEWPVVFVTGLEQGFVPISHAGTAVEVAEEQRLLHVALGRAADALHLGWARRRTFGTRTVRREPSPWLERLARAVQPGPVDRVPDPREGLAAVRATLSGAKPLPPRERRARPR